MTKIAPFRGLRPRNDLVDKIIAPPYDVINSDEARDLAEGNEHSFLHVSKPEIDLDAGVDSYGSSVYAKGKESLDQFVEQGFFSRDEKPCFYINRLTVNGQSQTGIYAGSSIEEYETELIKKHELTRAAKEKDRTTHTKILDAQTGPVFLAYHQKDEIDSIVNKVLETEPTYDVTTYDGVRNELWVVEETDALVKAFEAVPCTYIADGHHRAASYSKIGASKRDADSNTAGTEEYNSFLSVIFPGNQLNILAYNRFVKDLNGMSIDEFIAKAGETFDIQEGGDPVPEKKHQFRMYLDGKWWSLTPKSGTFDENDPVKSLDVSVLQENLLAPVLGIEDPRRDNRIDFIGGIRGTEELEKRVGEIEGSAIAFSLYPVSIEDLFAIADAGEIMPPKSTWFEPKLKDGFVLKLMD